MMSSGLAIDIDVGPAEDDAYKYKNYLNDPNWPFFVKCAKKYGFIVDKNIPWRLTFDLFTDASLYFIGNRISPTLGVVGKENFFAAYYTPTYFTDIGDLRNLIVNAYRLFVASNPIREEQCLRAFERGTFVVNKMARLPLASDLTDSGPTIQAVLSDKYMADMYLRLRHTESQKPFRISETVRNQMAQIYEAQHHKALTPLQNVAAYINWLFRDYIYSTNYMTYASTPALNYLLGLDISPGSGIIDSTGESSPTSGDDNSSY
jgi:hypothetical protein